MSRPDPLDEQLAREMLPAPNTTLATRALVVATVALTALFYALLVWWWLA